MWYSTYYNSPLGQLLLASNGYALKGLWMENQKYYCNTMKGEGIVKDNLLVFRETKSWLNNYFDGNKPSISGLPLEPDGSLFCQAVWKLLCNIPYGSISTYKEIAKQIAAQMNRNSMAYQAVGIAIGHNPIAIIIPCHRIIGTNGSLTGYAGGIEKKKKLLELEGVIFPTAR